MAPDPLTSAMIRYISAGDFSNPKGGEYVPTTISLPTLALMRLAASAATPSLAPRRNMRQSGSEA